MKRICACAALAAATLIVCAATGQELHQISPEEAIQHIIKRVEPRYPPTAELARIQGVVTVRVIIDEQGRVTEAKAVSGHPLLIEPSLPAVRNWRFAPFVDNGTPVPVSSLVTVTFSLAPDADRQRDYLQREAECNQELQGRNFPGGESACGKALKIAAKLPKGCEADKMRAYGNAGAVAFELKKMPEALNDFKQQLEFAKQARKPGSRQMIQVRRKLIQAYLAADQLPEADAEYTELEKAAEAAEADLDAHRDQVTADHFQRSKESYAFMRKAVLQEHATLLRKMGKTAEADALEQQAGSRVEGK